MKLIGMVAAALILVTVGPAAPYKSAGDKPVTGGSSDGRIGWAARVVEMRADNAIVASGQAHLRYSDPAAKTTLDAYAEKMTIVTEAVKPSRGGSIVKSASMAGPVKIVSTFPDSSGAISTVTATADSADYDGATNIAHLAGNVKIVNENPAIFAEPAVMVGDKATVNLSPNVRPEDFRFRVESSPGLSTITVTPKPKESQ
jgi:lipopolysaccharide export system protein LptA